MIVSSVQINEHINIESGKGESIVSFAHREGCQLIVIGTRGLDQNQNLRLGKILNLNFKMRLPRWRSPSKKNLKSVKNTLGSISESIVHRSWIPILICPRLADE